MARKTRFELDADTLDIDTPIPAPATPRAGTTQQPALPDTATPDTAPAAGPVFNHVADQVLVNSGGVYAQASADAFILGTADADYIMSSYGNDFILGADGDDQIWGQAGHDTILGGNGHDFIDGGDGADWLLGEAGDDQIFGGNGHDRLQGGEGNDRLMGMAGADVMTGGAGRDEFIVGHSSYWLEEGFTPAVDTITDLELPSHFGGDRINVMEALNRTEFFAFNADGATARDAFAQGYLFLVQHGTLGEPGFGTQLWTDSNGAAAGGTVDCIAEIVGVAKAALESPIHNPFFF